MAAEIDCGGVLIMRWRRLLVAALAVVALVTACGGSEPDLTAATIPDDASAASVHIQEDGEVHVHTGDEASDDLPGNGEMNHDMGDMSAAEDAAHDHAATREVAAGSAVPTVALEVTPDPASGWNVQIALGNFRLAPERASTDHVEGEGHMHMYIDGAKVNRLYGLWYHLGHLEPGEREIRVELSANDHATLTHNGEPIDATVIVTVPAS
ncbi:MAG: hypothetical protein OXH86_05950 [Acidimicrobiaceae bacterium]|nr:hypothetical protein [Acidimicrobiaceae bacterium]